MDDCLQAIRTVVKRHESLRTLFAEEDGSPVRQDVQERVNVPVFLVSHPLPNDDDGNSLLSVLPRTVMDTSTEVAYRIGVQADGDSVKRLAVIASHLIVDGWGFENLLDELVRETRAPGGQRAALPRVFQQLDQVEWESGRPGERRREAAIAHHRADALLLESVSLARGKPALPDESVHLGGISLGLSSQQLEAVARRFSVGVPALLLASYTKAVSAALGVETFLVRLHCANRFSPARMRSVTRLKSTTTMPCTEPTRTWQKVAAETRELSLMAYQHAQFPPEEHIQVLDDLLPDWREGAPLIVEFNDRRAIFDPAAGTSPGAGVDLTPFPDRPVVSREPIRRAARPFMGLAIDPCLRTGGAALKLETNLLSPDMIEDFLSGVRERFARESRITP
ncbi:condensation domain-containing protein [Streptomyces sp. NPDC002838]|uniref:condensation domain-containing protein n=1 Tax=Streptomyces sp. NPDC002838 TaxID=3154436 RepID=UPI00332010EE